MIIDSIIQLKTNVTIRRAEPADIDNMVWLLRQLFTIEADFEVNACKQRQGLEELLKRPSACVLVAER